MRIKLAYDKNKDLEIEIPDRNLLSIAHAHFPDPVRDPVAELKRSLSNPIASPRLSEMVDEHKKVAIVVTDMTRYAMDETVSELLLEELHRAGVRKENIFFLIALGMHRPMTHEEIEQKLGKRIANEYEVYNHDCHNDLVDLGCSSAGFPMKVNRKLMEADVKITVGVIEPHLFAGYSGGVKTICVGLAGVETIGSTHSLKVLSDPRTKLGLIENNIFREFLNEMAERVKVDFTVNLVLNEEKRLVAAFSGHPIESFESAVKFTRSCVEVPVRGCGRCDLLPGLSKECEPLPSHARREHDCSRSEARREGGWDYPDTSTLRRWTGGRKLLPTHVRLRQLPRVERSLVHTWLRFR